MNMAKGVASCCYFALCHLSRHFVGDYIRSVFQRLIILIFILKFLLHLIICTMSESRKRVSGRSAAGQPASKEIRVDLTNDEEQPANRSATGEQVSKEIRVELRNDDEQPPSRSATGQPAIKEISVDFRNDDEQPPSKVLIVDLTGDEEQPVSNGPTVNNTSNNYQPVDFTLILQSIKQEPMSPTVNLPINEPVNCKHMSQSIKKERVTPPALSNSRHILGREACDYDIASYIAILSQSIKQEPVTPSPRNKREREDDEAVKYLLRSESTKEEPMAPAATATAKPFEVQPVFPDEDGDVIMGMEEFNPNYLPREPFSPSDSKLSASPSVGVADDEDQEQTGAGGFTITDKQSAHDNYLSNITLKPKRRTGHLHQVLEDLDQPLSEHLTTLLAEHRGIKVYIVMGVEYEAILDASKTISDYLHTHFMPIFSILEIPQFLTAMKQELILKNENFVQFKSGLRLKNIPQITLSAAEHQPLAGNGFQELPPFLANKKCIINVNNRDNRCFGYALLASLEPSANNRSKAYSYTRHFAKHHLDTIAYPVKLDDIPAIEATLPFAINVFSFDDDTGRSRFPKYNSLKTDVPVIDLLYWNEHFALIKDFNTFMCDISKTAHLQHFCRRCFGHFRKESSLLNHQRYCLGFHGCKTNIRMPKENSKCEFNNIKNQLKCPFVIYADFECLLPQNPNQEAARQGSTVATQMHIPYSVGFKLIGPDLRTPTNQDGSLDFSNYPYEFHTGEHPAEWLLNKLMKLESAILKVLFNDQRIIMTEEDNEAFAAATKCHICEKGWDQDVKPVRRAPDAAENLDADDDYESDLHEEEDEDPHEQAEQAKIRKWEKVRDHDHLTGKYRGAAHNHCNWMYRKQFKIPVFFHNLRNYDGHLIVRAMESFRNYEIKPIAQGLEKYLIIGWGKHLVFKDTLQFMATSLEQLAKNLLNKGREHFVHLQCGFSVTPEKMDLILRKGVFPYDFMRNWRSVDFRKLPSRQHFFNNLKQAECSVEDYEHARTVWKEFGCQTMKDYSELYMKTGILSFFLHADPHLVYFFILILSSPFFS